MKRTSLYVIIAVVVVVVILLLVLVLSSLSSPKSNPGGLSGSGGMTYDQARPIAVSSVASYQGGGWAPLFAAGYGVNTSYSEPVNASTSVLKSSSCTYTPAPGVSGNITIPGISGNRSGGVASAWIFAFRNGAGNVSLDSVVGGQGTVLGSLSGGECTSIFGLLQPVPGNVIDSSQAAAAVSSQASAFLAAHPSANSLDAIIGGITFLGKSIGPEWEVEYTTCSPMAASGVMGSTFNATVDALNGSVLYAQTTASVVCSGGSTGSGSTPLGTALAVIPTTSYSNGVLNVYNLTVVSAGNGVTWSDTIPQITDSSGTPIGAGTSWSLVVSNSVGTPIAYYNSSTPVWSGSPDTPIVAGDDIAISASAPLSGDLLEVEGTGTFSGSITSTL
jgi:hypothetical protein